jgi:hypothetical protein
MRGESGLYLRSCRLRRPSAARAGYMGFTLGWRVTVPG